MARLVPAARSHRKPLLYRELGLDLPRTLDGAKDLLAAYAVQTDALLVAYLKNPTELAKIGGFAGDYLDKWGQGRSSFTAQPGASPA